MIAANQQVIECPLELMSLAAAYFELIQIQST